MTRREWTLALVGPLLGLAVAAVVIIVKTIEPPHMASTVRMLKTQEGFRGLPYPDAGGQSVGYGTHFPLSPAEAEMLLVHRLGRTERELAARWAPYVDQPEHIKQALSLMAYQLGVAGELMFKKMFAALERGDRAGAAREALDSKWAEQTPKRVAVVAALLQR